MRRSRLSIFGLVSCGVALTACSNDGLPPGPGPLVVASADAGDRPTGDRPIGDPATSGVAVAVKVAPVDVTLVATGESRDIAITVTASAGDDVDLGVDNVPLGVSAVVDPLVTRGAAILRLTRSAEAKVGPHSLSVVARTSRGSARAQVMLQVAEEAPSFDVVTAPSAVSLQPGGSVGIAVSVIRRGSFDGPVTVDLEAPPGGFQAQPLVVPSTATAGILNVQTNPFVGPHATGKLTVRAKADGLEAEKVTVDYTVAPLPGSPDETFAPGGVRLNDVALAYSDGVTAVPRGNDFWVTASVVTPSSSYGSFSATLMSGVSAGPLGSSWSTTIDDQSYTLEGAASTAPSAGQSAIALVGRTFYGSAYVVRFPGHGFADNGRFVIQTPNNYPVQRSGITSLPGGIVAFGANGFLVLHRLTDDGAAVASFGTAGRRAYDAFPVYVQRMIHLSSGHLALAGSTPGGGGAMIARLHATTGAIDPAFGTDGFVSISTGAATSPGVLAILQSGDNLLVLMSGAAADALWLVRLTSTGALDPTFGQGGKLLLGAYDFYDRIPPRLAEQPDGKIVIGVRAKTQHEEILRVTKDGELDVTFGIGGHAPFLASSVYTHLLALTTTDKTVTVFGVRGGGTYIARLWQ